MEVAAVLGEVLDWMSWAVRAEKLLAAVSRTPEPHLPGG